MDFTINIYLTPVWQEVLLYHEHMTADMRNYNYNAIIFLGTLLTFNINCTLIVLNTELFSICMSSRVDHKTVHSDSREYKMPGEPPHKERLCKGNDQQCIKSPFTASPKSISSLLVWNYSKLQRSHLMIENKKWMI